MPSTIIPLMIQFKTSSGPGPIGILGVVQTPFHEDGTLDFESHERLVRDALAAGVDGFLVPAIASENAYLSLEEKIALATHVQSLSQDLVPVLWGTGSPHVEECLEIMRRAEQAGAAACLVAVPPTLYREPARIIEFFAELASQVPVPLMAQDWEPGGTGMQVSTILELARRVPSIRYLKIETLPAGPKYTAVLEGTQGKLHVSGGWAVQQMIEALDRGVHAMIPECSMIRIYKAIDRLHRGGNRAEAIGLFNRLVPVLCFTNQELEVSIRFFKRLLVRKGIFSTCRTRLAGPDFDRYMERTAGELIEHLLQIERELRSPT